MSDEAWDAVHAAASVVSGALIGAAFALAAALFLF